MSATINGLNSSMVNGKDRILSMGTNANTITSGLQILPSWQTYFHMPEGNILGRMLPWMLRVATSDLLYFRAHEFGTKYRWTCGKIKQVCQEHFLTSLTRLCH